MESQIERLAEKAWRLYQALPLERRLIIAVSGMPGSGKTTFAAAITYRLNSMGRRDNQSETDVAAFVPMDGFHLIRKQLDAMPDPEMAHARRGAAFTFDASGFLALIRRLREPLHADSHVVYAPSFDHSVKDPVQDDIVIEPSIRIVISEGNYLSLGTGVPEWKQAAGLMDELWFLDVKEDTARQRLIVRHMIGGRSEREATDRAEENDLPNGREIVQGRLPVHEVIKSLDDPAWQPSCPYVSSPPNDA